MIKKLREWCGTDASSSQKEQKEIKPLHKRAYTNGLLVSFFLICIVAVSGCGCSGCGCFGCSSCCGDCFGCNKCSSDLEKDFKKATTPEYYIDREGKYHKSYCNGCIELESSNLDDLV